MVLKLISNDAELVFICFFRPPAVSCSTILFSQRLVFSELLRLLEFIIINLINLIKFIIINLIKFIIIIIIIIINSSIIIKVHY